MVYIMYKVENPVQLCLLREIWRNHEFDPQQFWIQWHFILFEEWEDAPLNHGPDGVSIFLRKWIAQDRQV